MNQEKRKGSIVNGSNVQNTPKNSQLDDVEEECQQCDDSYYSDLSSGNENVTE